MPATPPVTAEPRGLGGNRALALDESPRERRESHGLAILAIDERIREHQRLAKAGVVQSLAETQGTRECLQSVMALVARDIHHDDARTRLKAGVLALRAVELAEIFLRDGPAASAPRAQGGDIYNVVQIDTKRREALQRLARLTADVGTGE